MKKESASHPSLRATQSVTGLYRYVFGKGIHIIGLALVMNISEMIRDDPEAFLTTQSSTKKVSI